MRKSQTKKFKFLRKLGIDCFGLLSRKRKSVLKSVDTFSEENAIAVERYNINAKLIKHFKLLYQMQLRTFKKLTKYKRLTQYPFFQVRFDSQLKNFEFKNLIKNKFFYKKGLNRVNHRKLNFNLLGNASGGQGFIRLKRYKDYYQLFLLHKQFRYYYGNLSYTQSRNFFKNFLKSKKRDLKSFFNLLENRVDFVMFKCGFFSSVTSAREFVKKGRVCINDKVITNINFLVRDYDLVSFKLKDILMFYKLFLYRLKSNRYYIYKPKYYEINYKIMCLVLIKSAFTVKNIQMPFNLNKSLIRAMFKFL